MEMKYGNMAGNGSNSKVEEMQLYQGMCDSIRSRIKKKMKAELVCKDWDTHKKPTHIYVSVVV